MQLSLSPIPAAAAKSRRQRSIPENWPVTGLLRWPSMLLIRAKAEESPVISKTLLHVWRTSEAGSIIWLHCLMSIRNVSGRWGFVPEGGGCGQCCHDRASYQSGRNGRRSQYRTNLPGRGYRCRNQNAGAGRPSAHRGGSGSRAITIFMTIPRLRIKLWSGW